MQALKERVSGRHFGADTSLDDIARPNLVLYAELKDLDNNED